MPSIKKFFKELWKRLRGERVALIIPAISSDVPAEVARRFDIIKRLGVKHVHLDVADGVFSAARIFDTPQKLAALAPFAKDFFIEVHLMVTHPQPFLEVLAKIGVRRALVHAETMSLHEFTEMFFALKRAYPRFEVGVVALPETAAEYLVPYGAVCGFLECLGVAPGYSGQAMKIGTLEKVAYIRRNIPSCIIEVDGGVHVHNAGELKRAGADILVSSAYIFSSPNPIAAYAELFEA